MRTIPTITLRHRLRIALEDANVDVAAMALELGVSRNTVGNYLSGRTKPPASAVRVWADVTETDAAWLYGNDYPNVRLDLTEQESQGIGWSRTGAFQPTLFDESDDLILDLTGPEPVIYSGGAASLAVAA